MKMRSPKKKSIKTIVFYTLLFAAFANLIFSALLFINNSGDNIISQENDTIEVFRENIKKEKAKALAENDKAYKIFLNEVEQGDAKYHIAISNIDKTVAKITSLQESVNLTKLMISDKIKKNKNFEKRINEILAPQILQPCTQGNELYCQAVKNLEIRLQENNNRFRAACEADFKKLSIKDRIKNRLAFSAEMRKVYTQTQKIAMGKIATALGTAIEAVMIKQTISALAKIFLRLSGKVVTSAGLPLIDGPLPIGDILAIGGLTLCAYDIYDIMYRQPKKLKKQLKRAVLNTYQNARSIVLDEGQRILSESNTQISAAAKKI